MLKKVRSIYTNLQPFIHIITREAFQVTLITYLSFSILEVLKPGFVSSFFKPDLLLAGLIPSGFIMMLTEVKGTTLDTKHLTKMIWHRVFYRLSSSPYTHEHTKILKISRAKEIVKKGSDMDWRDWYFYDYEQRVIGWLAHNIPDRWIFKHLSTVKERDWEAFISEGIVPKVHFKDWRRIVFISLAGAALIYNKTQYLGALAFLIAGITVLVILLISYLILTDLE